MKNHILIDFENVQPKNLEKLKGHDVKVYVFLGAHQTKMPVDLAIAMQALGEQAEYIRIDGTGPNALDFHIAFYMGKIAEREKTCFFHIISKDKGYEPLIKHIKSNKILAKRSNSISSIPFLKMAKASTTKTRTDAVVEYLLTRGPNKPRTDIKLENTIKSLFSNKLDSNQLREVIKELANRNVISSDGNKIKYLIN